MRIKSTACEKWRASIKQKIDVSVSFFFLARLQNSSKTEKSVDRVLMYLISNRDRLRPFLFSHLIVLKSFDQFLARLQQRNASSHMALILKLHLGPSYVQLLQNLLHSQFLGGLVYDSSDLVFKVVQIEGQQIGQVRVIVHDEFYLWEKSANLSTQVTWVG